MRSRDSSRQGFDLAHPQRRAWFSELLYPGTGVGNLAGAVRLAGSPEQLPLLQRAIEQVIAAHDALRLQMVQTASTLPRQVLVDPPKLHLRTLDVGEDPTSLLEAAKTPLPLFDAPLYQFDLLRFSGGEIGYFFKYHHATVDALTVSLLNRRIHQRFRDLVEGRAPSPFEPNPSFLDFLDRERAYLESPQFHEDEDFWRRELDGVQPQVLDDRGSRSIATARYEHTFDAELSGAVTAFGAEHGTTPFRLFMALFFLYFARRTRGDDVVIITGHHNRIHPGEKGMAGMTVSTLPIRFVLDQGDDFRAFLRAVHEKISACLAHQQYPFDLMAAHLREQGVDPQQILAVSLNHVPSVAGDYHVDRYSPGADMGVLDIKLNPNQRPRSDPLQICVDARREVFDQAAVELLFARIEGLLRQALAAPETRLRDLEVLTPPEREAALALAHQSSEPAPRDPPPTILSLFDDVVCRHPGVTAVVDPLGPTSYRDLRERSLRLARRLARLGVSRGAKVAISLDRGVGFVVAVLAVLRAGGAYVPVNPGTPPRRARAMLDDAEAAFLISEAPDPFPGYDGVVIAPEVGGDASEPAVDLPEVRGEDLAYVMFTSGSTGRPKGAMIDHRALAHLLSWVADLWELQPGVAAAGLFTFMFDPSVAEIFSPLCRGATLHLLPAELRRSIRGLNDYFIEHDIAVASLTTRVGELFLAQIETTSLRTLTVAGEQLDAFRDRGYRVFNAYGPTEVAVYATFHQVTRAEPRVPIGRPAPGLRAYVVDEQLHLVPPGEEGELLLAGPQVGRGYASRPELTEQVFVKNPFSREPEASVAYRTGDRVRFRDDGRLEYLGRRDRQLKLRGYRVEPSEVEQVLLRHPSVAQCVVTKHPRPGAARLCAFYTIGGGQEVDEPAIVTFLAEHLPDFMVPEPLLRVDAMPLTPRGKTDREALLARLEAEPPDAPPASPPRTETEARLLEIWRRALPGAHLGTESDFFDSGGDSIQAMRVFAEIEETFGRRLPVSTIFQARTVERLASRLSAPRPTSSIEPVVIRRGTRERPLFCVHDITGDVMPYTNMAQHLGHRLTLMGLRYDDSSSPAPTIEALATRYLAAVRAAQPRGPYDLLGYSIGGTIAYEMAQQLRRDGQHVSFLGLIDTPNFLVYDNVFDAFKVTALRHVLAWWRNMSWAYKLLFLTSNVRRRWKNGTLRDILGPHRRLKAMALRYRPVAYDGPVVLWKARERLFDMDLHLGWDILVSDLEVHEVEGGHISLLDPVRSRQIAEGLEAYL